jgi:glucosylceramidase
MTAQPAVYFNTSTADAGTNSIVVDAAQQYQTMDGFGAAFTDSAAYLLYSVAQPSKLTSIMSDLFTTSGGGIGLSFMRIPMGATDIARSVYSFDDQRRERRTSRWRTFRLTTTRPTFCPSSRRPGRSTRR